MPILPFPFFHHCWSHLATSLSSSPWLIIGICHWNFHAICHTSHFWFCYFWLLATVVITYRHFSFELSMVVNSRIATGISMLSLSFRNISISGFGNISGQSLLEPLRDIFFELAVVKNPGLPVGSWWYLAYFQRYKYFRFWQPHCYF